MVNETIKQSIGKIADNPQDAEEITNEFFIDSSKLTEEFVPEFLAYFLFEEYDEEKFKKLELGFEAGIKMLKEIKSRMDKILK